jgi:hypothetical protein
MGGTMAIDLRENLLCDVCSNAGRGVKLPDKMICLDCAGDDPELVVQIVHLVMPEMAAKLEAAIKAAGIK